MAKPIAIQIVTSLDAKGARDAERLIANVTKAQIQAAQGAAKVAAADAKAATAHARAATEAQKLATATARTQAAHARAATEAQKLATATARTQAAQSQAAGAALRLAQAQTKVATASARAQGGVQRLARGLGGIERGFAAVGVAVGAQQLMSYGADAVRMAAGLDTAKRSLLALAGTPKLYEEALASAREQQRLFGGSLEDNISGIQGLITVSRSSGAELSKLIDLTQRLSIKDPAQGIAGARIALNEALAGDPTSLAKRYEIPKAALKALRDESLTTQEKLKVLDDYLNSIGITSEVASGSVSPLAVSLNELGAASEGAQAGLGALIAAGLEKLAPALTGLFNAVESGLGTLANLDGKLAETGGALLSAASGWDDFSAKQTAAANELAQVGVMLPQLNEAAYNYAQSLMAQGVAAEEAAARAAALPEAFSKIQAAQTVLREDTAMTDAELLAVGNTMGAVAAAGGPLEASLIALITAFQQDRISAADFMAGLMQLSTATAGYTALAGASASAQLTLNTELAKAGPLAGAASGGMFSAAAGADAIGNAAAAATPQLAGMLGLMERISGRIPGALAAGQRQGAVAGMLGRGVQAAGTQSFLRRISVPKIEAPKAGGGGAARISEAEKTADRLVEIEQDAARRLMEIDARLAEQRIQSQRRLAEALLTSANDFAVESQINDLDFFGEDISDEDRQRLADRERAEAKAKEAQKAAIEEAKQIAADGDAELAEQTYQARQDQIRQQQQLDETYAAKQREVGAESQAALTQQYQEATDAIAAQTDDKIALAQAEAQARVQAIEAERQAVLTAAADQASALLGTKGAADQAASSVEILAGSLRGLPTNVTTTVTIRTVNEGGESVGAAESVRSGETKVREKPTAGNKAAGGADFVTTGPMTLRVGDNPGGVERVTVTPISGRGRTRISGGAIHLAGGGVVDSAADSARARLDAGTTPSFPVGGAAKASRGGAASAGPAAATDALEAEAKALALMLDVLDLRERVAKAQVESTALDHQGAYANALRRLGDEAQFIALVITNRLVPLTEQQAEALGRYVDAAEGAQGVIGGMLDLRAALKEAGDLTTGAIDHQGAWANALRRLGDEAQFATLVVANRLLPSTEAQAEAFGRYVDMASGSLGLLAEVADLRSALREPQPPLDLALADALASEAQRVTAMVRNHLLPTTEEQAAALGHYADAAGASIGVLRDMADLRQAASEGIGLALAEGDIARLADDAQMVARIVRDRIVPTSEDEADGLSRYADAVGSSVSALRDTLDLRQGLFEGYAPPSEAQIGQLAADANRLVRAVETAARVYDTAGLEAAQRFGDALGRVVGAFRDTLAFNEGLLFGAAVAPDAGKLAQFQAGASAILDTTQALAAQAQGIPQSGLAALQTATAAITAQADAMIRLAAVPFTDLPRVAGAFGPTNAGSVGGGVTVNIYNPPAGMDVGAVISQVKTALQQQAGMRR